MGISFYPKKFWDGATIKFLNQNRRNTYYDNRTSNTWRIELWSRSVVDFFRLLSTSTMATCIIPLCTTEDRKSDPHLTFHQIPTASRNKGRRESWLQLIRTLRNEPDWTPTPSHKICSRHFLHSHFSQPRDSPACLRVRLVYNAFPTLHLGGEFRPEEDEDDEVQIIENENDFEIQPAAEPAAAADQFEETADFGGEKVNLECHEVTCPSCFHQFSFFLQGDENQNGNETPPPRKRPKIATNLANNSPISTPLSLRGNQNENQIAGTPKIKKVEKDPLALEEEDKEKSSQVQIGIERSMEEHSYTRTQQVFKKIVYNAKQPPKSQQQSESQSPKKAVAVPPVTYGPASRGKKAEDQEIRIISVRSIALGGRPTRCPSPAPDLPLPQPSSPTFHTESSPPKSVQNVQIQQSVTRRTRFKVQKSIPISIVPTKTANNAAAPVAGTRFKTISIVPGNAAPAATETGPKVKLKEQKGRRRLLPPSNPK